MKNSIRVIAAVAVLSLSGVVTGAGIPTFDVTQSIAIVKDLAEKATHYQKQYRHHADRLGKLRDTVTNLNTHLENTAGAVTSGDKLWGQSVGQRLSIPEVETLKNLYGDWDGGTITLAGTALEIYNELSIDAKCASMRYVAAQNDCTMKNVKQAKDQAFLVDGIERVKERLDTITELVDEINLITTPKEMNALTARINAEQASLQAEEMQLDMFSKMMDIQDKLLSQRQQTTGKAIFQDTNVIKPVDVAW